MAAAKNNPEADATHPLRTAEIETTLEPQVWRVTVVDGPDAGVALLRDSGTFVVGSHEDADLTLADPTVSRYHAQLTFRPDGVLVKDLNSRNGVRAGKERLERVMLGARGRVQLGRTVLEVRTVDPSTVDAGGGFETLGAFISADPATQKALEQIRLVADTDASVLIEGGPGSGKSLLAAALHQASPRRRHALEIVDCAPSAATPVQERLLTEGPVNAWLAARHGTVVLDRVDELAIHLQAKVLQAIEEHAVRRSDSAGARLVATTRRDLQSMVATGTFADALFVRLAVVRVRVPPLRARTADIPLLAQLTLRSIRGPTAAFTPAALSALATHDWPANVRELRQVIERAAALTTSEELDASALFGGDSSDAVVPFREGKEAVVTAFERSYVEALLHRNDGNVSSAAREAGLSRNALYGIMKRVGIQT